MFWYSEEYSAFIVTSEISGIENKIIVMHYILNSFLHTHTTIIFIDGHFLWGIPVLKFERILS